MPQRHKNARSKVFWRAISPDSMYDVANIIELFRLKKLLSKKLSSYLKVVRQLLIY